MQYDYYYKNLSPAEKQAYKAVFDGVKKHISAVSIPLKQEKNLPCIIKALEYDHPELYYWNCQKVTFVKKASEIEIKLNYFWKPDVIKKNIPKIEMGVRSILSKCSSQYDSEYSRFKSIYDCMVRNIHYDFDKANSSKEKDIAYSHTILGVFAKKTAVCDGISKSLKYVLERSGIDCIVTFGSYKNDLQHKIDHAWNIVFIDDKPCHVDLTWAVENSDINRINHDYFCLTDNQICKDHQINKILVTPKCNSQELDYYIRNNTALKSIDELKDFLRNHTNCKPFEINVRLDFVCDISEIAKKAANYIIEHYVLTGSCIDINTEFREEQNILIITGK